MNLIELHTHAHRNPTMSTRSIASTLLLSFVLVAAALVVAPLDAQTSWPIDRFQVVNVEPAGLVRDMTNPRLNYLYEVMVRTVRDNPLGFDPDFPLIFDPLPMDPVVGATIQAYLRDAAAQLRAWGFPAPALDPVVTTATGDQAYRVYLVEGLVGASGEYMPDCSAATERVILLNAADILTNGRVHPRGHQTLGHELYHAVQAAMPFHACTGGPVGSWITEGQARAIGWDLVREVRPGISLGNVTQEQWGPRMYGERLSVPRPTSGTPPNLEYPPAPSIAYNTSSFWRYLAEYAAAGSGGWRPGPDVNPVDYGFLAQMLRRGPALRDCSTFAGESCSGELRWLDAGLTSTGGRGLREAYANFIQVVALYGKHRPALRTLGQRLTEKTWRDDVFDPDCVETQLYEATPSRGLIESFLENSAQCLSIETAGLPGDVLVSLTVEATQGQANLKDLTAALAGRPIWSEKAPVRMDAQTGRQQATWVFELPNADTAYVLLANMADDPSATLPITDLPYEVRLEGYARMSDGGGGGPLPSDIDRPLPIELDTVKMDDVLAYDGVCRIQFSFENSTTGDVVALMMNHVGPIRPNTFSIFNPGKSGGFDFGYIEDNPGTAYVSFGFGPGNGMTNGFTYGYIGRGGTVAFSVVSPKLIRGTMSVTGELNVCLDDEGHPSSLDHQFDCPGPPGAGTQAQFSFTPGGSGPPQPSAACFEPAPGGRPGSATPVEASAARRTAGSSW